MAKQSLFAACKRLFRDGISGTYIIGNTDIFLELYSQQDIDQNNAIGNSSEENIVVVAGDTITIPEGYTLTPVQPKKSLVVICNTFVNNGTVSMYQKAPNVLPHDLFIVEKGEINSNQDVIIPAYAKNAVTKNYSSNFKVGANGNNGINRNCGSGGTGTTIKSLNISVTSGSGYSFGGGAGSGGSAYNVEPLSVDSTYPMRGTDFNGTDAVLGYGGVGNPTGARVWDNRFANQNIANGVGCGGRIIIFCSSFTNNGNITVNGSDSPVSEVPWYNVSSYNEKIIAGGASGAGAVDIFYTTLLKQGTVTANGGNIFAVVRTTPGKGGDGSITFTPWEKSSVLKPIAKYMSRANMIYFLTNYIERLKQGED